MLVIAAPATGSTDPWAVLSAIGSVGAAVVAVAALVLSIVNYVQARETRVSWRVEREDPVGSSRTTNQVRLVNTSTRFAALVEDVSDADPPAEEGAGSSVYTRNIALPATVEPGNWITVEAWQFLGRPKTRMTITWRQRRANGKWVRPVRHRITLFR